MTTITVWLLVSLGGAVNVYGAQVSVIDRFATVQECERVGQLIAQTSRFQQTLRCIQATVVKP